MNPPPRENDVAPLYGSGELIQRAGVIRYLAERARAREREGEHLAAAGELELAARGCAPTQLVGRGEPPEVRRATRAGPRPLERRNPRGSQPIGGQGHHHEGDTKNVRRSLARARTEPARATARRAAAPTGVRA